MSNERAVVSALSRLNLSGQGVTFGEDLTEFPADPELNRVVLKDGIIWQFTDVVGISNWLPLTAPYNIHIHNRTITARDWVITHNLNSHNIIVVVYDNEGSVIEPIAVEPTDKNTVTVNLDANYTGRAFVFTQSAAQVVDIVGNAATADRLANVITINNVPFDGSASVEIPALPPESLAIPRDFVIGDAPAKAFDGTANVTVTLAEMGAASVSHDHDNATEAADGFMSAADKLKLNQIAENATSLHIGPAATDAAAGDHNHDGLYLGKTATAESAAKLSAPRTIALSGGATGTATAFDGSAGITIPVTALNMDSASAGTLAVARGGTGTTTSTGTGNVVLSVSPTFTGTPQVPTATAADNTTTIASTAFVKTAVGNAVAALTGASPVLDTLKKLSTAVGDDANYSQTVSTALATKLDKAGGTVAGNLTVTGTLTAVASSATKLEVGRTIAISGAVTGTATAFDGSGNITIPITALNVGSATAGILSSARGGTGVATSTGSGNNVLSDSPALSGTPTAPTAVGGTNTAQLATTAFVQSAVSTAVSTLMGDAPAAALDTLKELGDALGNDANFATTVTNSLAAKFDKAGGTISGDVTVSGTLTANASSAVKLATSRTIAISGAVTGTATAFDGTGNITIPITALNMASATTGTLAVARGGTGVTTSTGTGSVVLSASPTFTGTPLSTTAADGTNTTQVATTAFVQAAVGGYLAKAVTGGTVTLTDAEASNPVIALTGTLTSNLLLVVPTTVKRLWAVFNSTAGAFTVTVKTAAGTGVLVAQGKRNLVYTDGTNVLDGFNDFNDIAITGNSTATTPLVADNSTRIATTAFVQGLISSDAAAADTAVRLKTARTIAISGGATGTATSFDGTGNITIPITALNMGNATAGTLAVARGGTGVTTSTGTGSVVLSADAALTGAPTAPTAVAGTNTTQLATTAFVQTGLGNDTAAAATAVKLKTARTIAISGGATGTATSFDGTANITIPITALNMGNATAGTLAVARGGTGVTTSTGTGSVVLSADAALTGAPTAPTAVAGTNTAQIATTAFVQASLSNDTAAADSAVRLKTARTIAVSGGATGTATAFDGTGNITIPITALDLSAATAGTLAVARGGTGATTSTGTGSVVLSADAALTGAPTAPTAVAGTNTTQLATTAFVQTGLGNDTAAAATAVKLKTARTIAISGGATGTATSFDGTGNITIPITALNMGNATAGTLAVARGGTGTTTSTGTGSAVLSADPALTGVPTAPNAADGTNTTQLATTAFVQNAVGGYLAKAVTGGTVTLTDAEASNPVIALTGTLTSALNIVVPVTVKRIWCFANNTTGAFITTVKTAAGTGVTIPQGLRNHVFTDGTNVLDAFTDYDSIAITGAATAVTQASTDNSTLLATTAFVQSVNSSDTGGASTALTLKTARTIAISGGATGTATSFNGSANITIPITALNMGNATAGTLAVARGGTGVTTSTGTGNNVLSASPTFTGTINAEGIVATGEVITSFSDQRLKTVIGKIQNALDLIDQLNGVIYRPNALAKEFGYDTDDEEVGLLAQDVERILPQLVERAPFDRVIGEDKNASNTGQNYLTVRYNRIGALLAEGIKELRREQNDHERRIARIEEQLFQQTSK